MTCRLLVWHQVIIWTSAGLLLIIPLGANKLRFKSRWGSCHWKKMKISSADKRLFLCLDVQLLAVYFLMKHLWPRDRYSKINSREFWLHHCGLVTHYDDTDLGGHWFKHGLVPSDIKPLPEPKSTNHQRGPMAFTQGWFHRYPSLKHIWRLLSKTSATSPRDQRIQIIQSGDCSP